MQARARDAAMFFLLCVLTASVFGLTMDAHKILVTYEKLLVLKAEKMEQRK